MRFRAKVIPSGNATAVEVPEELMGSLGREGRPPVAISINGHSWRSRIAVMHGKKLIGISAAQREAASISEGDTIEVDIVLDEAPRVVEEPQDMREALDTSAAARAAFDALPFGLRAKHVRDVQSAKSAEVRMRRIGKLVEALARG